MKDTLFMCPVIMLQIQNLAVRNQLTQGRDEIMKKQPDQITVCVLECVLMPQGEIICKGKTIGWFKEMKEHLTPKESS